MYGVQVDLLRLHFLGVRVTSKDSADGCGFNRRQNGGTIHYVGCKREKIFLERESTGRAPRFLLVSTVLPVMIAYGYLVCLMEDGVLFWAHEEHLTVAFRSENSGLKMACFLGHSSRTCMLCRVRWLATWRTCLCPLLPETQQQSQIDTLSFRH